MSKREYIGEKFGKLTVLKEVEKQGYNRMFLCKCDCGKEVRVSISSLTSGNTRSCGHHKYIPRTHGLSNERIYMIRAGMRDRCNNPNNDGYSDYGGRGISVCEEWDNTVNGFENFYEWAKKNGYRKDLTIDRIDVNGNYEPSNCRWATMKEQARNQRVRKTNKIGVSGVTVDNRRIPEKRYRVTFQVNGKYTIIGNFGTVEEAIEARKQAELKYWGYTKIV